VSRKIEQRFIKNYRHWINNYDTLNTSVIKKMEHVMLQWGNKPIISIIMPTYNTDERWLRKAIDSVLNQIYPHWELCIADDASTSPHVADILREYAQKDSRIKLVFRTENGHISEASNSALALATGHYITFLDHDDMLSQHALFWVVEDMQQYPNHKMWYSDEDKVNESDERYEPYFKCDWNPDLFLSHNLVTHLAVYHADLIREVGGLRKGYEGAQDYDLVLRVIEKISPAEIRHIPRILYHWRAIQGSTATSPDEKPYALLAAQKAIGEFLQRKGIQNAEVSENPEIQGTIRVKYPIPDPAPLVSLIIPTRNGLHLLQRCVESILAKTLYRKFEIIIIDNESDDPETLAYFQQLEKENQARIISYPHPFNYADMNNMAVEFAQGELIGLLNNDLEVINPEWLGEMVSHAIRPEIGVVGARLWYPNETLQHAGVVLGIGGCAGHAHKGFKRGDVGYFGRAALIQNYSAVTGACLLVRKTIFVQVGGLNAEHLKVAFNDVDFCLKTLQLAVRCLWTPFAELYHHESASRGYEDTPEKVARFEKERHYLREQWPQYIIADPNYSPNLTLDAEDFSYCWPPRLPLIV
jgi:glycosyltransferase involved in cell wall biosynthesis